MRAAAKEFTDAGLKIMSGGNVDMKETTIEGLRPHFEYAKAAGMPMMVCAPLHENIKMIEALVKEYDIRIAIHNHGPEDKQFPTPQSVLEAVRSLDPRCGLCMDVGHSARAGADVVKSIAEAGSRLLDMHVKDLRDFSGSKSTPSFGQCDCGDGEMPFPGIFKQLKKLNYQGCVNLEYEINDKNPMPGMQRSFSYMRGVLAGTRGCLTSAIPIGIKGRRSRSPVRWPSIFRRECAIIFRHDPMHNIQIGATREQPLLVTSEVAISFLELDEPESLPRRR